ncbi:type I-E CRISPR-associated protein Cse1/CasA [Salinibacter altiplanensis]|uniref:type I-E CRISPR-associated protein Cse1/CasA n=1 Tax=Salinibacter altiplanensis TaxID=1803181 RepID=UPI000C9FC72B|nr:type I-E CRISPR-associated protein Cse1/CasA [Salinibacter altiplanensis]
MEHSLLDDLIFRIRLPDGTVQGHSLPQILHRLTEDDILSFEALQAHQQQAWHSFLVQLAAMAVDREAGGTVPSDAAEWREALVELAEGDEAAWHLVVADVSRPAFLQSPVPEGTLDEAGYKADVPMPDQLDVLITSKSHDVKARRIRHPRPEHWIYALVTLQTMEGFLGRGNYGIVRMNGGFGNRPLVGLANGLSWGARFQRDVDVLRSERGNLADRYTRNGRALLWTAPWDGVKASAIPLEDCDPYFLEICRRIRFQQEDGDLVCWRANTKGQRVDAPDSLNGDTGDPWTPIEKSGGKALTLPGEGFTYDRLQEIVFEGEYARPPALQFRNSDEGHVYLVARALVRGQGKTEGLHHRIVPVPASTAGWLREKSRREQVGQRARDRAELVQETQRSVLYPAIGTLLGGGDIDAIDFDDVAPWLDAFDRAVDARFFEALWASVEMSDAEALEHWQTLLWEEAQNQFEDAEDHAPSSSTRYWRARSSARSIFHGAARNTLSYAFSDSNPTSHAKTT